MYIVPLTSTLETIIVLFFFCYFLFPSLSTLQGGLNSFRGTLRCEYRNAEKDVV